MTNFRKLFKPENFEQTFGYENQKMIVQIAQSILNEALDKATVVYEKRTPADTQPFSIVWSTYETDKGVISNKNTGRKALLINVEPIKECSHENYKPKFYIDQTFSGLECVDCGKKIIPTGFKIKE